MKLANESGLSLLEVIISALLVGLIAVGTLTGFATAGKKNADERTHAQATVCAQQDEERLRGMTATEIGSGEKMRKENENCEPYKEGEPGTVFTVTSEATPYTETESGAKETCTLENEKASYLKTTSEVTWPALGKRDPVYQSSIVTTPLAASLEVKVKNQSLEPVEGAEVNLTAAGSLINVTQTTGSGGCVLFGYVNANAVVVKAKKAGWVGKNGESEPTIEASLAGDSIITKELKLANPGTITATFKTSTGTPSGETFVASQSELTSPTFFVAGTAGTPGATSATLQGLYPFAKATTPPEPNPYIVYAGDCEANNPLTVSGVKPLEAKVSPGSTANVTIEEPPVAVTVYEGSSSGSKGNLASGSETEAKITNIGCAGTKAQNVSSITYIHTQKLSAGALQYPGQPYAKKLKVCVGMKIAGTKYTYTTEVANTSSAGVSIPPIYLTKSPGSGYETGKTC